MHLLFLLTICFISLIINSQHFDTNKKRKYEVIFIGFALFLFAALRDPSVGTDVQRYCDNYTNIEGMTFSKILSSQNQYRDPVFTCFMLALTFINNDPQFMLAVVGAWVAFCFSYFVYHSRGNVLLTYLLFICLRIYSFTLTGLRQAMAMGFIWLAFVSLYKSKKIRFIVFVMLGAMFHASAISFIIALALMFIKSDKFVLLTAIAVTIINTFSGDRIVYYLSNVLFSDRFEDYVDIAMESGTSFSTTFILYVLMFVFIIIYLSQVKKNDRLAAGRFNIVCIGMMLSFIAQGFPNMFRIAYYFICNLFPLFTETLSTAFIKQRDRTLVNFLMATLLIAQYVILGTSGGTENYIFFWQGINY